MVINDKKPIRIKKSWYSVSYPLGLMRHGLDYLQQVDRNSREIGLAGKYLQSIGQVNAEQQWRALLKQRCFKNAGTMMEALESIHSISEEHWSNICNPSY